MINNQLLRAETSKHMLIICKPYFRNALFVFYSFRFTFTQSLWVSSCRNSCNNTREKEKQADSFKKLLAGLFCGKFPLIPGIHIPLTAFCCRDYSGTLIVIWIHLEPFPTFPPHPHIRYAHQSHHSSISSQ